MTNNTLLALAALGPALIILACSSTDDGSTASSNGGGSSGIGGATGGQTAVGGTSSGGAAPAAGGASGGVAGAGITNTGGAIASGGTIGAGGVTATGGTTAFGGTSAAGGSIGSGGFTSAGGTDAGGAGGSGDSGGMAGSGGSTSAVTGPCDIYEAGNTPCVAAHSTVRALYGAYSGNLYQVRRTSDKTTKDIGVLGPGGFADSAAQDSFCSGSACTISVIYDQSPKGNHLRSAPAGGYKPSPDQEANATGLKLTISGHPVYAVYINAGMGYRNDATSGIATKDLPEGEYMVTSGKHYNGGCCFDYGNAETSNKDDGNGTMEAVYFGNSTSWGRGSGNGPWVMADLENGLFAGTNGTNDMNTPLTSDYVTAMVKGKQGHFAIKGGNAQSGMLKTMYDGARPTPGYDPMKKEGAIILGIGGDNSNSAVGTFFEGCMTAGYPSDATDDAVQANVVAAGYGQQ
ncbi:MAG TPA: arabinofuranosidase catalytic domain-containing protein [Polyangiaceae bacterium]|nr:arabinofuranosidase catalytic domain-containing protein [Polyangiaceae bacterium]